MKRAGYAKAPALLYTDANGVAKVVRDFFHSDIDEIVANSEEDYEDLDEAAQLKDISHMPARVKCAELAWRTLDGMLD